MDIENDTETGGEMSLDEAAAAFVKSQEQEATGQSEEPEIDEEAAEDEIASDEDDEESEGEPEDEESDAEEEGEDEQSEGGRFVASDGRVKLPDGTIVTVSDLVQGNLRDRDYRQKTMSLAEERREFEAQSSAIEASRQEVDTQREYMAELLRSLVPQQPDANMMNENSPEYDPIGYSAAVHRYNQFMQHLQYIEGQMAQGKQKSEQETQATTMKKRQSEIAALQEAVPELKDHAKLTAFGNDIQRVGEAYGFSAQEIAESVPMDHRMALVLRDAAKWRKLQQNKPKVQKQVEGRPPVQKSGKRLTANAQKARRAGDAINRLKETGTVEDAARAYLASQG